MTLDLGEVIHAAMRKAKEEKHMTFTELGKAYIAYCLKQEGYMQEDGDSRKGK